MVTRVSVVGSQNDNDEDLTHPHVFTEIANASSIAFPDVESNGTPQRTTPDIVISVNGYIDFRIPALDADGRACVNDYNTSIRKEILATSSHSNNPDMVVLVPTVR